MRIWSHLLKKSLMENFIFCAVLNSYISHRSCETVSRDPAGNPSYIAVFSHQLFLQKTFVIVDVWQGPKYAHEIEGVIMVFVTPAVWLIYINLTLQTIPLHI